MKLTIVFLAFAILVTRCVTAQESNGPSLPAQSGPLTEHYHNDAARILAAAEAGTDGYTSLIYLCDRIGNRLSGSPQLNTAIQWAADLMRKVGLQNVNIQPVMIPHWVRGREAASIVAPVNRRLHLLGIGMSVGTPKGGITAPVVFVQDFSELDALPVASVKGKIVVFNPGWHGYGVNVNWHIPRCDEGSYGGACPLGNRPGFSDATHRNA
jgi:hypothetical protein